MLTEGMVKITFDNSKISGVLSNEDIRDIIKRSSSYFVKEEGRFTKLSALNKRLKYIGQMIQTNYKIYTSKQSILSSNQQITLRRKYSMDKKDTDTTNELADYFEIKNLKNNVDQKELNKLIGEAYFLIMEFRKALLDENIDYMIYVGENNKPEEAIALRVQEENILQLMSVGATGITLRKITSDMMKAVKIKDNTRDTGYNKMALKTEYYRKFVPTILENDFKQKVENDGTKYSILEALIDGELKTYRAHLLTKDSLKDPDNHHTRKMAKFTMGHISEAYDIGFDQMRAKNISYVYDTMRTYFYENLYFDNIKATRGGDNAVDLKNQLSVKAFSASLYRIATIYGDIIQITDMFQSILDGIDERAKAQLESLFFEQSKYTDALVNVGKKTLTKELDKVFNLLVSSVNKS